jgi:biopolymer transport protein ExbD
MTPRAGVDLPESNADQRPESSVVLAINLDGLVVGDEPVATMDEILAGDDLYVPSLAERLEEVWLQREELARLRGETEIEAPAATIQGDRDIEFRVLQRVMYTLGEAGFGDVSLAVIKKS